MSDLLNDKEQFQLQFDGIRDTLANENFANSSQYNRSTYRGDGACTGWVFEPEKAIEETRKEMKEFFTLVLGKLDELEKRVQMLE